MRAAVDERDEPGDAAQVRVGNLRLHRRERQNESRALCRPGGERSCERRPERVGQREQGVGRQVAGPGEQARASLRSTRRRASSTPAPIEPSAYATMSSENRPGPPRSPCPPTCGTPTIQVPDEILSTTPRQTTAP